MCRIHFIQHVPFETPAHLNALSRKYNCSSTTTPMHQNPTLPSLDSFDLLVVLGGPMNIYDIQQYPWLSTEKIFLKKAINADKKILGICLGAQIIADTLGGSVMPNPLKEIGWFPVRLTRECAAHTLLSGIPEMFTPFHWHGNTFPIPPGATRIAYSNACNNQGFIFDNRIVGLQFHLETTPDSLNALLTNCADELQVDEYVQDSIELQAGTVKNSTQANAIMEKLFCNLSGVASVV